MSIRFAIPPQTQDDTDGRGTSSSSDSEDYTEEENNFEDWISDQGQLQICQSLFEDKTFTTATEALTYDKFTHGFDLDAASRQCSAFLFGVHVGFVEANCNATTDLDLHRRIRLINFIRKQVRSTMLLFILKMTLSILRRS